MFDHLHFVTKIHMEMQRIQKRKNNFDKNTRFLNLYYLILILKIELC